MAQHDIELAFQEQAMGLENPVEEMEEDQRRQIAYHEAGHAVIQYYLRPDERMVRVSIIGRSEALGYVLPVPNYDIYSLPLRTFVADILVSMGGHVATKLFLGEYWTGATGDFQNVRARLWQLAHYGYFGPRLDVQQVGAQGKDKMQAVEKFWRKLEDQTEKILATHSAEVHAVAQALLDRNDLTGKQCIEVIRAAATTTDLFDSENLLKTLVEETIINELTKRGHYKILYERISTSPVEFPLRVMHHDAKISNILFQERTGNVICPVDYDTVMPAHYFSDLGDMIRSMVSPEDEKSTYYENIEVRTDFYNGI